MTSNTKTVIRQILAGDVTATDAEKKCIETALRGKAPVEVPVILSYEEASKKLRRSVSRVRQLVSEKRLEAVRFGGKRASGVTERSVLALLGA